MDTPEIIVFLENFTVADSEGTLHTIVKGAIATWFPFLKMSGSLNEEINFAGNNYTVLIYQYNGSLPFKKIKSKEEAVQNGGDLTIRSLRKFRNY